MRCATFAVGMFVVPFLAGQTTGISGPVEAFLFDAPSATFRAVQGVLGAASFGSILLGGVDHGSVAPHQSYGIAYRGGQGFLVTGLGSAERQLTILPGLTTMPDRIGWSSSGTAAVVYGQASGSIQVVTGLPSSPSVGAVYSMTDPVSSVAIDSSGSFVAIGTTGEIFRLLNGDLVPLLAAKQSVSLSFSDDGNTLFGIDAGAGLAFAIGAATQAIETWPLVGLNDPYAIMPSKDASGRAVVYIAARQDQILAVYDASTFATIVQVPLNFAPVSIDPLGKSSFVLAPPVKTGDPMWTFTTTQQPNVYFVPAPAAVNREVRGR